MAKYASNLENDEVIDEEILTLAYSAIIDAMWASDVVEADEFCTYVLNVVIPQENLRKHLITCCFLFMEILYRANKNYDFCKSVNEIESIGDWHFDLRNQGLYFQYWSSAVKKYSFQKNHTNKFFLSAMKTLERKENTSLPMILILQQLRKWKV